MAKLKILSRCDRINKIEGCELQSVRYTDGSRTAESKSWVWILKIVTVLMENGGNSTLVVNEVSRFVLANKKRIVFTLNESRQDLSLKNKLKEISIKISLAQLD